jgi:hypothetical protein
MSSANTIKLIGALVCLAVVGLIGLLVLAAVSTQRRERERQDRLRQWATGHEWSYTPRPTTAWTTRLPGRNKRGVSIAVSGTMQGRPVSIGEYSYSESAGSNGATSTHHFVVVAIWFPEQYPPIGVRPRGALSKMGRALFGDERAVGHEQFDREFRVTASDAEYARRIVGPALVQAHLSRGVPSWDLCGNELLAYFPGRIDQPERIPTLVDPLLRVAALLGR